MNNLIKSPAEDDRAINTGNVMPEVNNIQPAGQDLSEMIQPFVDDYKKYHMQSIETFEITTQDDASNVSGMIRAIKIWIKQIHDKRLEITNPANQIIKAAIAQEKAAIAPLEADIALLNGKQTQWLIAERKRQEKEAEEARRQELKRLEDERKKLREQREAEARQVEEERKRKLAEAETEAELQTAMELEDKAEDLSYKSEAESELEEKIANIDNMVIDPGKVQTKSEVSTSSLRQTWHGKITDPEKFIKWAVDNDRLEFVKVDETAFNRFAVSMKKVKDYPGAKIYYTESAVTRKGGK